MVRLGLGGGNIVVSEEGSVVSERRGQRGGGQGVVSVRGSG